MPDTKSRALLTAKMKQRLVKIKRVYAPFEAKEGKRILVDRLWPRGISKQKAQIDLWLKDLSPSTELRKWFGHDPDKWSQFQKRYLAELEANKDAVESLLKEIQTGPVVLIYSASDEEHNDARVLLQYLIN